MSTLITNKKFFWFLLLGLTLGTITMLYVPLEVGYRWKEARRVSKGKSSVILVDRPAYVYDESIGFRYTPRSQITRVTRYPSGEYHSSVLTTNNVGQISAHDYQIPKRAGEFRIVTLGDSLTAGVTNNTPWPSTLEASLNSDRELKHRLGVSSFSVLNFGMGGTGVEQFAAVLENEALDYQPDLVLVNPITDDIRRKFIWMGEVKLESVEDRPTVYLYCTRLPVGLQNEDCLLADVISRDGKLEDPKLSGVIGVQRERLKLFSPYPFLLAKLLEIDSDLKLGATRHYFPRQGIEKSLAALDRIRRTGSNFLVLHLPSHTELRERKPATLMAEFSIKAAEMGIPVESMIEYLPLPDKEIFEKWFVHMQYDGHWSDAGARVYGMAVHQKLRNMLGGKREKSTDKAEFGRGLRLGANRRLG